ncbi:MAG: hypothetical protein IJX13_01980 [Clostridia bacterium]|nr:hypothetical protein [Clostridia bacterium]
MKTKLDRMREFYNGKWYILLVFCLNFIGHSTGYDVFFFVLMMLTVYLGCAVAYDLRLLSLRFCQQCSLSLPSIRLMSPHTVITTCSRCLLPSLPSPLGF